MESVTLTLNADRTGRASGYLGGLTAERYLLDGREVPDGTRLALLTPDGRALAAATVTDAAAEVSTDTQEVADLLRYQPVGAEAEVYVAIGDHDNLLAIVPARLRKNWLDDSAIRPPAPLPEYWTAEQTKAAIAEALSAFTPPAGDFLPLSGGTMTGDLNVGPEIQMVAHMGYLFAKCIFEGSDPLSSVYSRRLKAGDNICIAETAYGQVAVSAKNAEVSTGDFLGIDVFRGSTPHNLQYHVYFCGTQTPDNCSVALGYGAVAVPSESLGWFFNMAIGHHARVGWTECSHSGVSGGQEGFYDPEATSVFGYGTYSNIPNSTTLGASDLALTKSVQLTLCPDSLNDFLPPHVDSAWDDAPWIGLSWMDELSGKRDGVRISTLRLRQLFMSNGGCEWHGPWGAGGCCGDYYGGY